MLRLLGSAVIIFGVVWCAIILRWRAINRVPNGDDVVLYLVVLPLALFMGFVALRWTIDAIKKRREIATTTQRAADNRAEPVVSEDPSLIWQLSVFAADALFASGDSTAALVDAARASRRAKLHPTLRDNQGLPVFAAAVESVDVEAIEDSLPETAQRWSESRKRTLALAFTLASRMIEAHLNDVHEADDFTAAAPGGARSPRLLQLEWLLPARWSDTDRATAQTWLSGQLAALGWSAPSLQLTSIGIDSGIAALKRLDDLQRAFQAVPRPLPMLLLASDSHLDEVTIADWGAAHCLHGAGRPEGLVPGEGASALLLGNRNSGGAPELAQLHRLLAAKREKPVEKSGRLQADTLKDLVRQALARAQLEPDAPVHIVSDTDMRSSRMAESMHLAEQVLPESDPVEVLLPLGVANGECGAALALAIVAVAVQLTADTQQPGLIFSHHDAILRAAALVTPPVSAATTSSTPSLA